MAEKKNKLKLIIIPKCIPMVKMSHSFLVVFKFINIGYKSSVIIVPHPMNI